MQENTERSFHQDIAVIGMAGHFPGAGNIDIFWKNIKDGIESISFYTREELEKKGVYTELLDNPNYVYANGICEDADKFDASFFGYTPREADLIDPQQRLLLTTCYEALEHAGCAPEKYKGNIGVFAGCGPNNYLLKNLIQHPDLLSSTGEVQTITNSDKDYIATRVSYKLNLTGPGFTVQTACSTSLVAVHLACQSIMCKDSDIALAGGSFVQTPRGNGYMFYNGNIFSSNGHCCPFDKNATGMLFGEGAGIIVLKALDEAIKNKDHIWAVIKSTAINNDGSRKAGYLAPSMEGQAKVIAQAHAKAHVKPEQISYLEAHGTATYIGDRIEIGALTKAFNSSTSRKNFCAIGSVKANIGHLDAGAGIAGLIKTCLAIYNKQIPPSINCDTPNPDLHLENSPFFVNRHLSDWKTPDNVRIAGVSAFGVGGTNSHCIVGSWENTLSDRSAQSFHILPFSAKTESALQKIVQDYSLFFKTGEVNIADAAYTLQNGRNEYKYRCAAVVPVNFDKESQLEKYIVTQKLPPEKRKLIFMFTGQGSQYISMGKGLYEEYSIFRDIINKAAPQFEQFCNYNLIDIFTGTTSQIPIASTAIAQPLLFIVQYAIAELLKSFGIRPSALIGHSIGELTAACVSGVFSFEDAFSIVLNRGCIMQSMPSGSMLSINRPAEEIRPLLHDGVEISLINAPSLCVVSGTYEAIEKFSTMMNSTFPEVHISKLATSHAFHSQLMESAIEPFSTFLKDFQIKKIGIPFISNTHGTWVTQQQVSSPYYWAEHIRKTVDFRSGMSELLKDENSIFIEIGPGNSLSTFLSQFQTKKKIISIPTLRHPKVNESDCSFFLKAIAAVWNNNGFVNWEKMYEHEVRHSIPLPLYPLEKKKHWIAPVVPFSYDLPDKFFGSTIPVRKSREEDAQSADTEQQFRVSPNSNYTLLQNELEKKIVSLWEERLGINKIGTSDNFFDLGGHSLLASQIINRLNEQFKIGLPLKAIFNAPTVTELADAVSKSLNIERKDFSIILQSDYTGDLPVSYEQQRLWIVCKIHNNPAYNIPFTYKLNGKLDIDNFRKSINQLFTRHKILKTSIGTRRISPVCKVTAAEDIPVNFIDLSDTSGSLQKERINRFLSSEIRELFTLETGPLYRIHLIKTGADEHIFHFNVHHLVFDGWSWGIFVTEFKQIYSDLLNNRPLSLPPVQYQYYDFAAWQHSNTPDLSESVTYWKKQLEGSSPKINFPCDFERKKIPSGLGGREQVFLDAAVTQSIKKISKSENTTDFMVLISIWAVLLKHYSGDNDINIGTPTANRRFSQLEQIIGFFVNSIVLRFIFENEMTFKELLHATRQVILDALAHQDLPFEKLVEELKPPRALNYNPVFQMMFAWQNTPRPPLDLESVTSQRLQIHDCVAALDTTFYMWESGDTIEGEIEFSIDIISRDTAVKLRSDYLKLIAFFTRNPDAKINDVTSIPH